ncbi:claudin-4, partial [Silurus meridionalis]
MAASGLQVLGLTLAFLGLIGEIVICALPMWRVTAFIGQNIVTAQTFWEGLWMNCVMQSTGQMQCKVYDSMLALPQDLQAARALVVIAILLTLFVIMDFYNPTLADAQKRELGASLFIGWGAAGLLLLGGALFCCQCPKNEYRGYSAKYTAPRANTNDKANPLLNTSRKMISQRLQLLGLILAMIGYVGTIVICGLPAWKMTAFIGANIVTFQVIWEGLWMDCVVQTTGQMQCKVYDSLLILPAHLQAARALIIVALVVGIFGMIVTIIGGKCTSCVEDENAKAKISVAGGIIFIITGILVVIPVCWTSSAIIRDFYNPALTDAQKRELGPCLYIGFGCAALLIAGGALLCSSCPPKDEHIYNVKYSPARS